MHWSLIGYAFVQNLGVVAGDFTAIYSAFMACGKKVDRRHPIVNHGHDEGQDEMIEMYRDLICKSIGKGRGRYDEQFKAKRRYPELRGKKEKMSPSMTNVSSYPILGQR